MKYIVTVIESTGAPGSESQLSNEIFRQGFDELDLSKFVVALNAKPRGRPAKSAPRKPAGE